MTNPWVSHPSCIESELARNTVNTRWNPLENGSSFLYVKAFPCLQIGTAISFPKCVHQRRQTQFPHEEPAIKD